MKTILFSTLFYFVLYQPLIAQKNLPVIHANKKDVIIKFNGDTLQWWLQPELKPDVFSIGSTLKAKKVQFNTGIDSIIFDVQAGDKYDFIILLNNKEACYTQISALKNPIFLNKVNGIIAFIFIALLFGFVYIKRRAIPIQLLLQFGIVAPLGFWIITIIAGYLHGNYNHLKMTVSELGTIGMNSEAFMAIATLILAIASTLFSIGFYRASKKTGINTMPAVLSSSMAISMAWAAVFPSAHELHGALGAITLLLLIATLLPVFLWKRNKSYQSIKLLSLASFVMMMLFTLRFIPPLQANFEGLIQRFIWLGWSVWFVSLSLWFKANLKNTQLVEALKN